MTRVLVLTEGRTEEVFVARVLAPRLAESKIWCSATTTVTKHVSGAMPDFKGGLTTYKKVKNDLIRLLSSSNDHYVTTMFDYFRLPKDFPGHEKVVTSAQDRASHLEASLANDIANPRFIPFLVVHEFEMLLFLDPDLTNKVLEAYAPPHSLLPMLQKVKAAYGSAECINGGDETAPSKRILSCWKGYKKKLHGNLVASELSAEVLLAGAPRFASWIQRLQVLGRH